MALFALQTFRAHACKCQVMLSTVWFPVTSPKRSRPKQWTSREEKNLLEGCLSEISSYKLL